jgi:divalent metal cation (Fe/Co/Zn/Cd) transporter
MTRASAAGDIFSPGAPGRLVGNSSTTGWRPPVRPNPVSLDVSAGRNSLVASALGLSYFTIVWNGVVGAAALVVGVTTGSLALAGFALNALLDSSASAVLVWRFRKERNDPVAAEHLERRAQTWVIVAMVVVALYIAIEAARALINGSHPESSPFAFGIAAISLLVLPVLGIMKLRLANRLDSPALHGDGVLTLAAAALAAITLIALLANSLLDWLVVRPAGTPVR